MKRWKVGIVGTGRICGEHVKAFQADPRASVVALCGRTREGAESRSSELGLECEVFTDYQAFLQSPIDIVSIATPHDLHARLAEAAARAGKHLMIEKPMALNQLEADRVRAAVNESGVRSVVSFVLRWNPLFEIIKEQLRRGSLGRLITAEVDYFHGLGPWKGQYHWNTRRAVGGSSLLTAGCHAMDAVRYFVGAPVSEVFQYTTRGEHPDFAPYEYPPTSMTLLKFDNGCLGKVNSCIESVQPYTFRIHLVGTEGSLRDNFLFAPGQFPGQTDWAEIPTVLPDSGAVSHHPFQGQVSHLIDCIEQERESHANVEDAWHTHRLIYAADRSGEQGRPLAL